MKKGPDARGFTLIEVMMVVAIIGILASIAIPEFQTMQMRAKTSERAVIVDRIRRGVQDLWVRQGHLCYPAPCSLNGAPNPLGAPGSEKRVADWSVSPWKEVFSSLSDVEGAVLYTYSFTATEGANPVLTVIARGDVDGDGDQSVATYVFNRYAGAYFQVSPLPTDPTAEALGHY